MDFLNEFYAHPLLQVRLYSVYIYCTRHDWNLGLQQQPSSPCYYSGWKGLHSLYWIVSLGHNSQVSLLKLQRPCNRRSYISTDLSTFASLVRLACTMRSKNEFVLSTDIRGWSSAATLEIYPRMVSVRWQLSSIHPTVTFRTSVIRSRDKFPFGMRNAEAEHL